MACIPHFTAEELVFVRAVFPAFFGIELDRWHLKTEEMKARRIQNGQFGQYKLSLPGTCCFFLHVQFRVFINFGSLFFVAAGLTWNQ